MANGALCVSSWKQSQIVTRESQLLYNCTKQVSSLRLQWKSDHQHQQSYYRRHPQKVVVMIPSKNLLHVFFLYNKGQCLLFRLLQKVY